MMRKGVDASGKCELDLGGSRHKCRLDRMTDSGVELNCLGFLGETNEGDKAILQLGADRGDIPCRVKHVAAAKIQLRFDDSC